MHRITVMLALATILTGCAGGLRPVPGGGLDYEALMATPAQPVSEERRQVIERAKSLLGTPYKYGGRSPIKGFDCTGFVQYVFDRAAAVSLPRRSVEQVQAGKAVVPREIQPGDLVYFKIEEERSPHSLHIGIYLGRGRFIHAPSANGVVNIQSLGDDYWRTRFLGGRRILSS